MTHDVNPGQAQGSQDASHVIEEHPHGVRVDALRPVGLAEAAKVGHDHPKAGLGKGAQLVAPDVARVGEAVQQQDAGPGAGVDDGEGDAVGLDADGGW